VITIYRKTTEVWRQRSFALLTPESIVLGVLMALVGGFLDAYTYVSRDGVFANAQTGNYVLLGVQFAEGKTKEAVRHIPPILAFIFGAVVTEMFNLWRGKRLFHAPGRAVLFVEMVLLWIVGFLPPEIPNMVVTIMIAFVASIQFSTFRKLSKWNYNTTTITGPLLTTTKAAFSAIIIHDQEGAEQAMRFIIVLFSFLIGAFVGTVSTHYFGTRSIWFTAIILVIVTIFFTETSSPQKYGNLKNQ
jgi:uncharacterized membrane protein YoaK (UPF0700 family)